MLRRGQTFHLHGPNGEPVTRGLGSTDPLRVIGQGMSSNPLVRSNTTWCWGGCASENVGEMATVGGKPVV
jgi:hypothetical protein